MNTAPSTFTVNTTNDTAQPGDTKGYVHAGGDAVGQFGPSLRHLGQWFYRLEGRSSSSNMYAPTEAEAVEGIKVAYAIVKLES